jgi:hypothetical protein
MYYLSYPCQKLNVWWVVHKVNPCERLHTLGDVGYHDTLMLDDDVYQEEELPPSFAIDPGAGLDDLLGDVDDIEMPIIVKRKWKLIKKKVQLPRLRTGLLDRDADEFFANILLTTYSLKQDVITLG